MSAPRQHRARRPLHPQRGIIMITALIFLVVMTLIAIGLFRSGGLMDRISANSRDKERSFEAAQSALQFAEFWLSQGNGGVGTNCSTVAAYSATTMHVCSNALPSNFATAGFTAGFTYSPPNLTVAAGGGVVGGDVNYSQLPGLYIENKGLSLDGKSILYQVTAYGFGGSSNTQTILRSTYKVTPTGNPLDGQ